MSTFMIRVFMALLLLGVSADPVSAQFRVAVSLDAPGTYKSTGIVPPAGPGVGGRDLDESSSVNPGLSASVSYGFPNYFQPVIGVEFVLPREQEEAAGSFSFIAPFSSVRAVLPDRRWSPVFSLRGGPLVFLGNTTFKSAEYAGTSYGREAFVEDVSLRGKWHVGGGIGAERNRFALELTYRYYRGLRDMEETGEANPQGIATQVATHFSRFGLELSYRL